VDVEPGIQCLCVEDDVAHVCGRMYPWMRTGLRFVHVLTGVQAAVFCLWLFSRSDGRSPSLPLRRVALNQYRSASREPRARKCPIPSKGWQILSLSVTKPATSPYKICHLQWQKTTGRSRHIRALWRSTKVGFGWARSSKRLDPWHLRLCCPREFMVELQGEPEAGACFRPCVRGAAPPYPQ
jgi:hypothetical protein